MESKIEDYIEKAFKYHENPDLIGKGTLIFKNGDVYIGSWVNDDFTGYGRMEYKSGVIYEGEWKDSCFCGKGSFSSPQGHRYTGQFVKNSFNGHGCMEYPNGDVYRGEWREDMKWGAGRMSFGSGRADQIGTWEKGIFHSGTDYVLPKNCPPKAAKFFGEEAQLKSHINSASDDATLSFVDAKYTRALEAWGDADQEYAYTRPRSKRCYFGDELITSAMNSDDKDTSYNPCNCRSAPPKASKVLGTAMCPACNPGPTTTMRPRARSETKADENAANCMDFELGPPLTEHKEDSELPEMDDFQFEEMGLNRKNASYYQTKKFGGLGSPDISSKNSSSTYLEAKAVIRRLSESLHF